MLSKRYQQGFKLKKLFFLLCICFCVTLWDSWSEADETHAYGKYWNKAMTLHKQKRHKEAERMFSVAISKYPNVAKFHLMRAKFRHLYMGKYHDAISGYSVVIKIAPKSYPEAYWWRGVCLDKFGLYELAIRDYSNALLIKRKWGKVHLLRAKAYAKLGMIEKAKNDLKAVAKYNPKFTTKAARNLLKKFLEGRRDF